MTLLNMIDETLNKWCSKNPWTNTYGICRSILAFSSLLTLTFNKPEYLFKPTSSTNDYPTGIFEITFFRIGQNNYQILFILQLIAIIILFLVIIGWRPRITGVLHWYIAMSLQNDLVVVDGGSQVEAVFTLLLLPIALTDSRKWVWSHHNTNSNDYSKIIAFVTYNIFRLQVAILYFDSVIKKLFVKDWVDGTAVYYFLKDPLIGFNDFFIYISDWVVDSPFIVLITWGTLIVQTLIFSSLFIDKKYWKYILICAVIMHEIFALLLGLVTFSIAMLGVLILYLTPMENWINLKKYTNYFKGIKYIEKFN